MLVEAIARTGNDITLQRSASVDGVAGVDSI